MLEYKKWTGSLYVLIHANGFRKNGQRLQCDLFLFHKIKNPKHLRQNIFNSPCYFSNMLIGCGSVYSIISYIFLYLKIFLKHVSRQANIEIAYVFKSYNI